MRTRTQLGPAMRRGGTIASALALCAGPIVLTSCNIIAPVMIVVEGPPTIDAQYKLTKDRPTLILVDDNLNVLPRPRLRQVMSKKAQDVLLKEGALKKVIDSGGAYAVIARDRDGAVTSLIEVARAVGAEVVVCATVDTFGVANQTNSMDLECTVRVRVLDATKDTEPRVWPAGVGDGVTVTARYKVGPGATIETNTELLVLQTALAEQTGRAIAQLFSEHKRAESAAAGK